MTVFLETLAPVEFVFLVSALVGALGLLITTIWLAIAGGFGLQVGKDPDGQRPPRRVIRIIQAADGFTMMFGVAGMALLRLAGADPLWALLGAAGAGALLVGVIHLVSLADERFRFDS